MGMATAVGSLISCVVCVIAFGVLKKRGVFEADMVKANG